MEYYSELKRKLQPANDKSLINVSEIFANWLIGHAAFPARFATNAATPVVLVQVAMALMVKNGMDQTEIRHVLTTMGERHTEVVTQS